MLLARLDVYVLDRTMVTLTQWVTTASAEALDDLLEQYAQACFNSGRSLHDFKETINAVVDLRPRLRGCLPAAWDSAWEWRARQPGLNRIAMPPSVVRAMAVVALHWGWTDLAALILIGFLGMLRPIELLALTVQDATFTTSSRGLELLFVFIGSPKTRRLAARRQHVRIDDQLVVSALRRWWPCADGAAEQHLFLGTRGDFSLMFVALLRELGLDTAPGERLTPACLRPGGATWLFHETDSPDLVRFRGRWLSTRMLEIYIQEVAGDTYMARLPAATRAKVNTVAAHFSAALVGPPPPQAPP